MIYEGQANDSSLSDSIVHKKGLRRVLSFMRVCVDCQTAGLVSYRAYALLLRLSVSVWGSR